MPQDNNHWSRARDFSRGTITDVQGRVRDQEPMPYPEDPRPVPLPYPDPGGRPEQPREPYESVPGHRLSWPPTMVSLAEGARVDNIAGRPIHEFTGIQPGGNGEIDPGGIEAPPTELTIGLDTAFRRAVEGVEYVSKFPGDGAPWVGHLAKDALDNEVGGQKDLEDFLAKLDWLHPRIRKYAGTLRWAPLRYRDLLALLRVFQAAAEAKATPSSESSPDYIVQEAGGPARQWPNTVLSLKCGERQRFHYTTTYPIEAYFPWSGDETVCCYNEYYGPTSKDFVTGKSVAEYAAEEKAKCLRQAELAAGRYALELSDLQSRFTATVRQSTEASLLWLFDAFGIPTDFLLHHLDQFTSNCKCPPECTKRLRILEYRALFGGWAGFYERIKVTSMRSTRERKIGHYAESIKVPILGPDGRPLRDEHGNLRLRDELKTWTTEYDRVCLSAGVYVVLRIEVTMAFEIMCGLVDLTGARDAVKGIGDAAREAVRPPWR